MTRTRITCAGVTKRFPDGTIGLNDIDLELAQAERLAVVGPSGSGKSTLLLAMSGIYSIDSGEVSLNGTPLPTGSDKRMARLRREHFGFVFQMGHMVEDLTLVENVALPCRLNGLGARAANSRAFDLLQRLGIADASSRRPSEVSVGQAQRAAVARAVIHDPEVVFADEPTGSLDSSNGSLVMELIAELTDERGCSTVLVTHDASIASGFGRTIRMHDGRILT